MGRYFLYVLLVLGDSDKMKPTAYIDTEDNHIKIDYRKGLNNGCPVGCMPLYAIPKGYKLVPIEPTEEMLSAGRCTNLYVPDTYKAMIEAAPKLEDIE